MGKRSGIGLCVAAALGLAICAGVPAAWSQQAGAKAAKAQPAKPGDVVVQGSGQPDSDLQQQLLKLLRLSPTLTMVVVRDPSLLADQDYVSRNNPELAQFLVTHPEVARNPSFYLFSNLPRERGERGDQALERKIWPDMEPSPATAAPYRGSDLSMWMGDIGAFVAFLCVVGSLLWLIRMLMENRRWNRIFKLQTEVHTKLIDRFGSNQELLTYMGTDAGKRFLEAAPIPVNFDQGQHLPGPLAKVLVPLQVGVVLTLLGVGLLALRHSIRDMEAPLLVFGMVVLMPGLGFILSAGITWFLAGRLGLMPGAGSEAQRDGREQ